MQTRTTAEWMGLLQGADIPCVPLHDLDALIDDEHLAAVGFFAPMDHPTEGSIRMVGIPSRWSRSTPCVTHPAPRIGEHSVEILREAGFAEADIAQLRADGAVIDAASSGAPE